ncbi:hypothetical protein BBK82_41330 [Lentzea guizhouensis]|uniref:DUF4396 domain-containing protein n=1 Tax=Lentzea guizhouensis TaxID=1586287 RepID=A0A1B2HUN1_9PSEU|nr:DUF4396 domain-containing protein [Lentzea guizhouensis]ANZ41446.1 hypothetical protein BBK82_41330 [Lentzea guizhouensis]
MDQHTHPAAHTGWSTAISATAHCLTGCAIGEVLGMTIGTAAGFTNAATIALVADTLSIAVMELVDNLALLSIPGAMDAGVTSAMFWLSLAGSLAIAFIVTVPVNRWLIAKGRGHAVVPHTAHH